MKRAMTGVAAAVVAVGVLSGSARADTTFRCNGKLIESGMTRAEVQDACGPPTSQSQEEQAVRSGGRQVGKTVVYHWTYTSYSQTRVLVFDQDRLVSIR